MLWFFSGRCTSWTSETLHVHWHHSLPVSPLRYLNAIQICIYQFTTAVPNHYLLSKLLLCKASHPCHVMFSRRRHLFNFSGSTWLRMYPIQTQAVDSLSSHMGPTTIRQAPSRIKEGLVRMQSAQVWQHLLAKIRSRGQIRSGIQTIQLFKLSQTSVFQRKFGTQDLNTSILCLQWSPTLFSSWLVKRFKRIGIYSCSCPASISHLTNCLCLLRHGTTFECV